MTSPTGTLQAELAALLPTARTRIAPWVRETPTEVSVRLTRLLGTELVLKLEQIQHSGSFKVRGAFNKVLAAAERGDERDLITASSGNHGLAVSYVAQQLGRTLQVVTPQTASPFKLDLLRDAGAEVRKHGTGGEPLSFAKRAAGELNRLYVPAYNDLEVIAGQATLGAELMRQQPQIEAIFASVGGGGLVSGVAAGAKAVNPAVRVIGACAEHAATFYESFRAGRFIPGREKPTISDGTSNALEEGSVTLPLALHLVDEMVLVSEPEIVAAMRELAEKERWLVEGAAALAVAAAAKFKELSRYRSVGVILCGRTVDPRKLY